MRALLSQTLMFAVCTLLVFTVQPAGATDWMGAYFPLHLGASWTYENAEIPFDTFTESVFDLIEYEGQPAFRFGADINNHTIIYRDGGIITVFAEVEEGELFDLDENIVLGQVVDGAYLRICFEAPCDTSLIRVWINIDPALRSIYGLDPALIDMVLIASYDASYPPNLHNVAVESNLPDGVTPPSGAVTNLEWYLRGTGRLVRTLAASEPRTAGDHSAVWDGADARGRSLPSGTYFCTVATCDGSAHAKLCLLR